MMLINSSENLTHEYPILLQTHEQERMKKRQWNGYVSRFFCEIVSKSSLLASSLGQLFRLSVKT